MMKPYQIKLLSTLEKIAEVEEANDHKEIRIEDAVDKAFAN